MTSMIDLQVTELVEKSKYLYLITKCHFGSAVYLLYNVFMKMLYLCFTKSSNICWSGSLSLKNNDGLKHFVKLSQSSSAPCRVFWVGVFRGVSNCPSGIIKRILTVKVMVAKFSVKENWQVFF